MISLRENIASLNTQRHLNTTTSRLQDIFKALSSGLRINSAKDDPAGLMVADSLSVDRRVYAKGMRNINDGISHFNIAESAASELMNILFRLSELASQASNGTLGSAQRQALHDESDSLIEEYSRIISTTEFNGRNVFSEDAKTIRIQAGYGEAGIIPISIEGGGFSGVSLPTGDGTFGASASFSAGGSDPGPMIVGDLNGDGIQDVVTANASTNSVGVSLGIGDGTFAFTQMYYSGWGTNSVALGDFNGDGVLDIVATNRNTGDVSLLLGNGDGTFGSASNIAIGGTPSEVKVGDFDGDGYADIMVGTGNEVAILLGNGDGTFQAQTNYGVGAQVQSAITGDFNGDGITDIITVNPDFDSYSVLLGNGDGTFQAATNDSTGGSGSSDIVAGDFNNDGILDLAVSNYFSNSVGILLGNGDGTFGAATTFGSGGTGPYSLTVGDFNGDGITDLVTVNSSSREFGVLLGNGDGTFQEATPYGTGGTGPRSVAVADINGDGAQDLLATSTLGQINILFGNVAPDAVGGSGADSYILKPITGVDLTSQSSALTSQPVIEEYIDEINTVLGSVGAGLSRLQFAFQKLQADVENLAIAESRIRDADIAIESAELVKHLTRQKFATAVLAQANQAPQLALKLLEVK